MSSYILTSPIDVFSSSINSQINLYATGSTSNALNSGTLIIGSDSQGIYLKDGQTADNSGVITSSGSKAVGMYTDNVSNPILNNNLKYALSLFIE